MQKQKSFLEALQSSDTAKLVQYAKNHESNEESLNELFEAFPKTNYETICSSLLERINSIQIDCETLEQAPETFDLLTSVATIIDCFLDEIESTPQSLAPCVEYFHGILIQLKGGERAAELQEQLSLLCEKFWVQERAGREVVVPNALMYLIETSLDDGASPSVIRRLNAIREQLDLLDLSDVKSKSMCVMLLHCAIQPLFLRCPQGRRFVLHLFALHAPFVHELHKAIKNQIPLARKWVVEAYADIYFKAWKNAAGAFLPAVEYGCLQDFVQLAVHASVPTTFSALRRILNAFNAQKKMNGVDEMMLRVYQPILWRSLNVANATVRANAGKLLVDAFPLVDPSAGREASDNLLQRQVDALQAMLEDTSVEVRRVGVEGVCRVLGVFWELVPFAPKSAFLTRLASSLAFDASSPVVRIAVLEGLGYVLDNHVSHDAMKEILPCLRPLINDTSARVRSAFCELLLRVKTVRSIRFFDIVPLEQLLERLVADHDVQPVVSRLVSLLLPSFFPHEKSAGELMRRVVTLMQKNAIASRVFFSHAIALVPTPSAARLVCVLYRCLLACVSSQTGEEAGAASAKSRSGKRKGRAQASASTEEDSEFSTEISDELVSFVHAGGHETMVDIIVLVWRQLAIALTQPDNESTKKMMEAEISDAGLVAIQSACAQESRTYYRVFALASLLPRHLVPSFSVKCVSTLLEIKDAASTPEWERLVSAAVAWGQLDELLEAITSSAATVLAVTSATAGDADSSTASATAGGSSAAHARKSRTKRTPSTRDKSAVNPTFMLHVLNYLLAEHSEALLKSAGLSALVACLRQCTHKIERHMHESSQRPEHKSVVVMLSLYLKFALLKNSKPESGLPTILSLVEWCEQEIVPNLSSGDVEQPCVLGVQALKFVLVCSVEHLGLHTCELNFADTLLRVAEALSSKCKATATMDALAPVVHKLVYSLVEAHHTLPDPALSSLAPRLPAVLTSLQTTDSEDGAEGSSLSSFLPRLMALHRSHRTLPAFVSMTVQMATTSLQSSPDFLRGSNAALPPVAACVASMLGATCPSLLLSHVSQLVSAAAADMTADAFTVLAAVHLLASLHRSGSLDIPPTCVSALTTLQKNLHSSSMSMSWHTDTIEALSTAISSLVSSIENASAPTMAPTEGSAATTVFASA